MGKRHEKGVILIIFIILFSIVLLYLSKDISPARTAKENRAVSDISAVTNDIAVTDMTAEDDLAKEEDSLWILFDYLIFERKESNGLTALFPAILLLYIVLIGPVVYFWLKKRDQMEWMWIMIPILAIVFAGMIVLFGRMIIVESPVIDSLTVLSPGKDDVVYFTSTSPADEEVELSYDENVTRVMPIYEEGYAFSKSLFRLDVDTQRKGKVKSSFSLENNLPVGTIQNNTEWNFKHVMLCYGDYYCILPALAPKKTFSIDAGMWKTLQNEEGTPQMENEMVKKDCDRILKIAYLKFFEPTDENQLQISAVIDQFDSAIQGNNENLISYGLYQQWESVK